MKSRFFYLCLFVGLVFLISACQEDKEKNDYSGVSDLISERNKARHAAAENSSKKKVSFKKETTQSSASSPEQESNEELSSIILYEEQINIVGSESGRTLAKGVAYINKKGQIVRIKVLKD